MIGAIDISVDLAPLVNIAVFAVEYISQSFYKAVNEKPVSNSISGHCGPSWVAFGAHRA